MRLLKIKWRWLVLPFLVITIIFIAIYSFLHWLIVMVLNVPINGNIVEAYIPIILAFIIAWKFLTPYLFILKVKRTKSDYDKLYQIVAALAMAAPTVFTQLYLVTAAGGLLTLNSVNEIEKNKRVKYYKLDQYYIGKKHIGQYYDFYLSDESANLNCVLYLTAPIYSDSTTEEPVKYWLGKYYTLQLPYKLPNSERKYRSDTFYHNTFDAFIKSDLSKFSYLERFGRDGHYDEYLIAVNGSSLEKRGKPVVFYPREGPFENRNGNNFVWIFKSFGIVFAIWLVMIAVPGVDENVVDRLKQKR
jgi:rhomboid protease GluP